MATRRMLKRLGPVLFFLILATASLAAAAAGLFEARATSEENQETVFKYLRSALKPYGEGIRLSYFTVCSVREGYVPRFPRMHVRPSLTAKTRFDSVREIFRDDDRVKVTRNRSGLISITFGQPPMEILQTRIRSLQLTPEEQYNSGLAVIAVTETQEFEAAEKILGLKGATTVVGMNIVEPAKGLPHLPASFKNITVDEAFDQIARKFHEAVLYGVCPGQQGQRMIYFNVKPVYDPLRPPWFPED